VAVCQGSEVSPVRYRDAKFGKDVISAAKKLGTEPIRTAFRSPWQNGVAERWVGSCRRDLLDHVIILNERHLQRLMAEYISYYHEDRTHLGLAKDTREGRSVARDSADGSRIQLFARLVACIIVTPWQRKTLRPTCNLWHSNHLHVCFPSP